jgi:Ca2+-binding EF-hand superfamily protein
MWRTRQLFRAMDTGKNGVVSKVEYMQLMAQTLKRLDTNHNGKLERNELRALPGPGLEGEPRR